MHHQLPVSEIVTLSNGLKCLCCQDAEAPVEMAGIVVGVGSRDESDDKAGLAHFVEHTIFKGTRTRSSSRIIERMESIGGELNAYTTKESTVLFTIYPAGYTPRAIELLADLAVNSRFPDSELAKEREVVADEIDSYLDVPSDAVYDDFEDLIFAGSSLGHNILGNPATLASFTSQTCVDFVASGYTADNATFFYYGATAPHTVQRMVSRHFDAMPRGCSLSRRVAPALLPPFDQVRDLSIHQSHTILGARVCDMYSPSRYALGLMVNMLGGPGMSSMLNLQLRERRGLVYSVDATSSLLTDTGLMTIYFGCDAADASRCRRLTLNAIDSLAQTTLSQRRLDRARRQYLGQMVLASANLENRVLSMARTAHYRSEVTDLARLRQHIMDITPEQIRCAAESILTSGISSLTFR